MNQKMDRLKILLAELTDMGRAAAIAGWDQQVYMPRGGAEDRGNVMATLSAKFHDMATSKELGELLEALKPYAETLDPDSDDACIVRRSAYDYDRQLKVPTDYVAEFARVTTVGESAWEEAKEKSDFSIFRPHLEQIVKLRREYSSFFKPYEHIYDPLVQDFEPGLKTADLKEVFGKLRPEQIKLLQAIKSKPQVDDSFLNVPFEQKGQEQFGVEVSKAFGFDFNRGRQDVSAHPFTTSFGIDDVRITTHYYPNHMTSAIFSTMHESGHGLYEQGVSTTLRRLPLAGGASMAVHESQSRMWENLIGRSKPFWKRFYPRLQEIFPAQLKNVPLEAFYKAVNKVEPSFVRTEADEATYNMHIMLRMELEIALMEDSLKVKDLQLAWNARMQEFLGITPPNDRLGVLQDVHWSGGGFGYFPTYALGNLVSAQVMEKMRSQMPDIDGLIEDGKFSVILSWLRENIYRLGAKFEPQDLVQRVTGTKIRPEPYLAYLNKKYSEIYAY